MGLGLPLSTTAALFKCQFSDGLLGHEPQIDPWLTPYNRRACSVSKLIGVVATNEDAAAEME